MIGIFKFRAPGETGHGSSQQLPYPDPQIAIHSRIRYVLLFFLFCLHLLFLTQAFCIDDHLNLAIGKHILQDPIHPYNFSMVYSAGQVMKVYEFYANPPLNCYIVAAIIALWGENEFPLHLCYMLFVLLCALIMYALSRLILGNRENAVIASLLLSASPGVFVMSHTIMPDLPLLCFYLASMYYFLKGQAEGKWINYILCCVCTIISMFFRYSALTLLPLYLSYFLLYGRRDALKTAMIIFIPLIAFLFWRWYLTVIYTDDYWNKLLFLELDPPDIYKFTAFMITNISFCGGSIIFPLSLLAITTHGSKTQSVKLVIFVVGGIIYVVAGILLFYFKYPLYHTFLFIIMAFPFLFFLSICFKNIVHWFRAKSINLFLLIWIILLLCFNSSLLFTAVKYNLVLFAPVILIFLSLIKKQSDLKPNEPNKSLLTLTALVTILISFNVGLADREFANIYRTYAKMLYSQYHSKKGQVYFCGVWGWEYYMEREGAKPIIKYGSNPTVLSQNDVIIVPSLNWSQGIPENAKNRIETEQIIVANGIYPFKSMNGWANAGFYSNILFSEWWGRGILPYSYSPNIPLERFYIKRVKY